MTNKTIYGLPSIDMGDWEHRPVKIDSTVFKHLKKWIENKKTGFRVRILYPQMIADLDVQTFVGGTSYIVCKDEFCMGFTLQEKKPRHDVVHPSKETPKVFVDRIGGKFKINKFEPPFLTDKTHFQTQFQQSEFLDALKDAVPRMPGNPEHAYRWDGGFGYQVIFTDELQKKILNEAFIQNAIA